MERLADFAALALRNARLYDEAVRRRRQAEVLAELGRETTSLDLERVLDAVVERTSPLLGTSRTAVAIRERDGRIRIAAAQGMPDWIKDFAPRHPRDGATARAITERRPIWSSDILEDPDFDLSPSTRAFIGASGLRAVLAVPLLVGERVLGAVLTARDTLGPVHRASRSSWPRPSPPTPRSPSRTRNLFALEASRRTQIEAMTEVAREIVGELGRERLLRLVAERAGRLFDARGAIFILRGDQLVPEATTDPAVSFPPSRMGTGITGLCAQQRRGMLVNDYASRPEATCPGGRRIGLRRLMAQPLLVRDRLLGVITLSRLGRRRRALPRRRPRRAGAPRPAGRGGRPQRHPLRGGRAPPPRSGGPGRGGPGDCRAAPDVAAVSDKIADSLLRALRRPLRRRGTARPRREIGVRGVGGADARRLPVGRTARSRPWAGRPRAPRCSDLCWTADLLADPRLDFDDDRRRMISDGGSKAALAMPLRYGGRIIGVLGLTFQEPRSFSDEECALAQAFADQAAVALENARLFEEGERRRQQAEALARAARVLTGVRDVAVGGRPDRRERARHLPRLLRRRARARAPTAPSSSRRRARAPPSCFPPVVLTPSLGLAGRAVREGRLCWSRDVLDDPDIQVPENRRQSWANAGMVTALAAPLRGRGRTIGVLSLGFRERRDLSEDERALVEAFADQAAIALENARLYEEAERRRQEAEVIAGIARTMNASLEVDAVLQRVVEGARALCRSDIARIALRDPETGATMFRYWVNTRYTGYEAARLYPGTESLGGLVLMTGKPHRTDDWMADPRFAKEHRARGRGGGHRHPDDRAHPDRRARSRACSTSTTAAPRPFTDLDEAALVQLADHASIAIRNAKLFAAVQATGERLQACPRALLEVQEAERRHIARELHDEVGQALTAVKINLQMLRRAGRARRAAGRLDDSLGMVDRILQGVRRLSLDLRPSLLDDLGLGRRPPLVRGRPGAARRPDRGGRGGRAAGRSLARARHHVLPHRPGGGDQRRAPCAGHARSPSTLDSRGRHARPRRLRRRHRLRRGRPRAGGRSRARAWASSGSRSGPSWRAAAPSSSPPPGKAPRCACPCPSRRDGGERDRVSAVRIVLADDHALVRAGIRSLIASIPGVEVVAEAGDGHEVLALVDKLRPRIVLMDIAMPGLTASRPPRGWPRAIPRPRVIILSMHAAEEYALQALRAGAAGYLLKDADLAELELAIAAVARGQTYLSPAMSKHLVSDYRRRVADAAGSRSTASRPGTARCSSSSPRARPPRTSPRASSCPSRPSRPTARSSWTGSTSTTWPASCASPSASASSRPTPDRASGFSPANLGNSPTRRRSVPGPRIWYALGG